MSYTQWAVLACLSQHVGGMSPGGLREALGHDPGALTRVVDALQKKGYINRKRSRTDRRGVVVVLSPEGAKQARSLNDQIMQVMNSWLAPLTHNEADALVSGLQCFLSTLRLSLCGEV
jgi:DNA-binding MarR family transcriptional regulator